MDNSRKHTNNYFAFSTELLGIKLNIPVHARLLFNIGNRKARLPIDKDALLLQYLTIGFKLTAAALSLKKMEESAGFYRVSLPNERAEVEGEMDIIKQLDFQLSLESFFTFAWGAITSVMCGLYLAYNLKIKPEEIYFNSVKAAFRKEYPKSDIAGFLDEINNREWFKYVYRARNRMDHGQVPMFEFRPDGSVILADDQSVEHRKLTTNKNIEPLKICREILDESSKFEEFCSSEINKLLYE